MKLTTKCLCAVTALFLLIAPSSFATICQSGSTAVDCVSTVSKKDKRKDKGKEAPLSLGEKSHSTGTDSLGSVHTHEHGVVVQDNSQPETRVKGEKPVVSSSSPSGATTADTGQPVPKVKGEKPLASSPLTPGPTTADTSSHAKLQQYHETKAHSVQKVDKNIKYSAIHIPEAPLVPAQPMALQQQQQQQQQVQQQAVDTGGGQAQPVATVLYFSTNSRGSTRQLRQEEVDELKGYGDILPDGSLSLNLQRHGITMVVPQAPTVKVPDRIIYLTHTDGVTRAWPERNISPLVFNADGSINDWGLQHGYSLTPPVAVPTPAVVKAPPLAPQPPSLQATPQQVVQQTPAPMQIQSPNLAPGKVPAQAPQIAQQTPTPMQVQSPNLVPGTTTTTPADFRYFMYNPTTHAKTELTPAQIDRARTSGIIGSDGLAAHNILTRPHIIAEPKIPQPVPNQVPTPTPGATPQQVPQIVQVPTPMDKPLGPGKISKVPMPPDPGQMQVPTPQTAQVPPQPGQMQVPTPQPPQTAQVPPQPGQMQVPTPMDKPLGPGKKSKVPMPPDPGQMQVPTPQTAQVPPQPGQMQVPTPQPPQVAQIPPQPGQMQVPTPMDKPLGPGKKSKVPMPPDPGQMQVPTPQPPQVAQVPPQPGPLQVPTPTPTITQQVPQQVPQIAQTPNQVPSQVPTPTPGATPQQVPQVQSSVIPGQMPPPVIATHSLVPVTDTKLKDYAADRVRPHADEHVEMYHPTKVGIYRYEEAKTMKDDNFHLIVYGFKEP